MGVPDSLKDKFAVAGTSAILPDLFCGELTCEEMEKKEKTFEDAFKERIKTFFPGGYKNIAYTYIDASYFSEEEFKTLSVDALCKAIVKDDYKILLQRTSNSIQWLNDLLQMPNFYDMWILKAGSLALNAEIEKLVFETQGYRQKSFSQLTEPQAKEIIKLNRLIIEVTYPGLSPKSMARIKYKKMKLTQDNYLKFKDNFFESYVLGITMLASSEHGTIKGTINGGGDFIKNNDRNTMIASFYDRRNSVATNFAKYPIVLTSSISTEKMSIFKPSARVLLSGKAVVDVGYNGETGLYVLDGNAKVKEVVTGSEREVPRGWVAYVIPGYGISRNVSPSEIKINRWWE